MNDMSKKLRTVKTTKAGKDFTCIGADCPMTCCKGWSVTLDKKTFNLYRNNKELAPHISKKVGSHSRSSSVFGTIKLKKDGNCPLQDEAGLCKVQKQLGPSALSKTCSTFPRLVTAFPEQIYQGFTMGCPEAARLTIAKADAADIVEADQTANQTIQFGHDSFNFMPPRKMVFWRATYNFLQMATDDLWLRLTAVKGLVSQFEDLGLLTEDEVINRLNELLNVVRKMKLDTDPAIFQVEILAPHLLNVVTLNNDEFAFSDTQQHAILALNYTADDFRACVKNFVVARDIDWRLFTEAHPGVIRNLALNELFARLARFGGSGSALNETLIDLSIWLAYVRFMLIANARYHRNDFDLNQAALIIAQISRKLNHNRTTIKTIKAVLEFKFGDVGAAANLLIA